MEARNLLVPRWRRAGTSMDVVQDHIASSYPDFRNAHYAHMYGPPPDCKRFEVERSDSLRKCIRPLSGELFSGHSMMIRACRSF